MIEVKFSNNITYGCMLVDEDWYNSHTQIEDKYELFQVAENDVNSKMILLYIMDVGEKTKDIKV